MFLITDSKSNKIYISVTLKRRSEVVIPRDGFFYLYVRDIYRYVMMYWTSPGGTNFDNIHSART